MRATCTNRALLGRVRRYLVLVVRIRLLGPFEIEIEGGPAELPPSRRARALLAWLALHPGRHARSKVAATFWPDVLDSSARTSLRGAVAELRRSLGSAATVLVTARETIELAAAPTTWVDAWEFSRLVADGRLREALDLVRGPLLADLDDEWVDPFRDDHQRALIEVLGELTRQAAAAEARSEAIGFARRRVQLDPLSEPAGRELVRLLARSGDRAGALDAAAALTERLHRELGLGPDTETTRLIAQVRSQAATERPEAARAAPVPAPPLIGGPQATLVGRDAPLDHLSQVRHRSARQGGSVVLISGDPGIGKTSLAIAEARAAAHEGMTTLYGRCDEEGIVPFEPWVEAVGHALDHLAGDRVATVARDGGPALTRLFPQLREHLPAAPRPSQAEPDTERWRLFEAVSALLHELCRPAGLILVIDDVQWADRSTLLLLRHVLRTRRSEPITVVMTCRTAELPDDSYLHVVLAELRRAGMLTTVELVGLDETDVGELVARRRGAPAEREFVRALHQETEGNPFFVEEILRSVPKPSTVDHDRPADGGFSVPQGVHDLLRRRLGQLPKEVSDVLVHAAVIGRDFDLTLLGRLDDLDDEVLVDILDQAIGASVIDETGVGRYSFSHALFRSALYDSLSRTRRARLHLMVAQAFESLAAGGAGRAAEIAHHYLAAAHPDFLGRALEYSRRAYSEAMGKLAYEDAAAIAGRTVAALDAVPTGPAPETSRELPRLLLALGESEARAGDTNAARSAFGRAARLADAAGDGTLLAMAALGFAGPSWRTFGEVDREAVDLLDDALRRLPGDQASLRAAVQARLAIKLYFARVPDRVGELTDAAVAGARAVADPEVLAAALEARLWAQWHPDGVQERLDTALELLHLAERHNLDEWATVARRWRVVALLEAGRMAEARTEAAAHAQSARQLRLPYELMYAAVFATMRALVDGRLDEARRESAHVAAFGELRGGADALQFVGVHQVTIAVLDGNLVALVDAIWDFAEKYPSLAAWRAALAYALAESGRTAEAAAEVDRMWPPEDTVPRDAVWLPALSFLAFAVVRLADRARAAHLYRLLLPYAERPVVIGAGGAIWATVSLYLGSLAAVSGDALRAVQHFDDATRWLADVGATPWLAMAAGAREAVTATPEASQPA